VQGVSVSLVVLLRELRLCKEGIERAVVSGSGGLRVAAEVGEVRLGPAEVKDWTVKAEGPMRVDIDIFNR